MISSVPHHGTNAAATAGITISATSTARPIRKNNAYIDYLLPLRPHGRGDLTSSIGCQVPGDGGIETVRQPRLLAAAYGVGTSLFAGCDLFWSSPFTR